MRTELKIPITDPFNFIETLRSHGWIDLLPHYPAADYTSYERVEQLSTAQVVLVHVNSDQSDGLSSEITVHVDSEATLSPAEIKEIIDCINYALRLNEAFQAFYVLCEEKGGRWRDFSPEKGFLFRSPDVFEDLVKVICTTNIQWGGTKRMIKELVDAFGQPYPLDVHKKTFPTPKSIASVPLETFKEKVRLGYRAGYVHELANLAASRAIDLDALKNPSLTSEEIRKQLLAIKGIGNYAAASMMMLLGRYDFIPVDTVFRDYMQATYFKDALYSEAEALKIYEKWGRWKYLAYWFEMLQYYRGQK